MKELVVGLDGSDESRRALRWAAFVAEASDAALRVVEAWVYSGVSALPGAETVVPAAEMDERTANDIRRIVREELGELPAFGTIEVLRGPAAGALIQTLTPASTLVLGSRGRGGFAGLLLCSVSRECIEHAPCPVVIVRHDKPLGAGKGPILVGKDGSPNGERALDWAIDLRSGVGGEVVALHAWQAGMSEVRPRLRERLESGAQASVEGWVAERDDVRAVEVEDDARAALVDAARDMDASVVVVGRRGSSKLRGIALGSVTSYLMSNSPTTVAVVPEPNST